MLNSLKCLSLQGNIFHRDEPCLRPAIMTHDCKFSERLTSVKQRQAWDDSVVERLMDIDPDLTEVQAILSSIRSFSSVGFWICGMIT